ncbi:hypothetical protein DFJ74DRAFT_690757 [Hyaloraphidium curvatum]|nr:hypothetical protein DFJ74DRAFT_690757 [Hyaloraphidium curvatum]
MAATENVEKKSLIPPALLRFYPYAEDQAIRIVAMKGRLRAWNVCVTEVAKAFEQLAMLEKEIGMVYTNLATVLVPDEKEIAGSSALARARDAASRIATEYGEFQSAIANSARQLASLRDAQISMSKSWASTCDRAFLAVEKSRIATANAVFVFERAKDRLPTGMDQWLVDQVLRNAITKGVAAENQYQGEMAELGQRMVDTEAKLVGDLQKVFNEHHAWMKTHSSNVLLHYGTLGSFLGTLTPLAAFEVFNKRHDVANSPAWNTARTIPDFPFTIPTSKVIKEGFVGRPGGFWGKGKDSWAVISDKGFFHVFDHARPNLVTRAIGWAETKKFETMDKPDAVISIKLRRPKVDIGIPMPAELLAASGNATAALDKQLKQQGEDHAFEITVRGGSDSEEATGPETKYTFKAETEEQMVDWMVAIKKVLDQSARPRLFDSSSPSSLMVPGSGAASAAGTASTSAVSSANGSPRSAGSANRIPAESLPGSPNGKVDIDEVFGSIAGPTRSNMDSPTSSANPWQTKPPNLFEDELTDDFFGDSPSFGGGATSNFEEVVPRSPLLVGSTTAAPSAAAVAGINQAASDLWQADFASFPSPPAR